jgi:CheY-like chemotaxis protein
MVESITKLSACRILVVEDESIIALDVADILEQQGATVVGPAGSVAAARRLIANSQIDCAVLDINLDHESVAPLVRELDELKIPFVFATGYPEGDMSPLWRTHPIVRKPMNPPELISALVSVCRP